MKKNKIKLGFSMGEVMLSVFILGTTLITITSLFSKSSTEIIDNRDSVIAAMLAQEGIEIARNNRDTNWTIGGTGDTFDNNFTDSADCQSGLSWSDADSKYTCSSGKFKRSVNEAGTGDIRTITSMVVWKGNIPTGTSGCTVASNCVYSQAIFSTWGDN